MADDRETRAIPENPAPLRGEALGAQPNYETAPSQQPEEQDSFEAHAAFEEQPRTFEDQGDAPRPQARPDGDQPFVRQRRPHHTQPPVNDVQADDAIQQDFSYESSYTFSKRGPVGGRSHTYRRSRSDMKRAKKTLRSGQYLSVPKGSREIFSSHDRIHRKQMIAVGVAVAAVAIIIFIVVFLQH